MVSRPGALPAPLPLRARALRALARCDLLRSIKMQADASADPAKNIALIELTRLLLVHNNFNHILLHNKKLYKKLKNKLMLNVGGRKDCRPPIPSRSPPRECIANHTACLILRSTCSLLC